MSTEVNDRYSLDYDPEFEEMLKKFKSTKFHSSLLVESAHEDDGNHTSSDLLWSPSFSPISFIDSPEEKKSTGYKTHSHVQTYKHRSAQKQIMQVDNVVIELSDEYSSSDEALDSGTEDVDSIDLNGTYTAKTMGNRRLSQMLNVIKEIESDEVLEQGISNMKLQNAKQLSKKYNKPQLPLPEFISTCTPSPCTPSNRNKPHQQRSYRLVPVSEYDCIDTPRLTPRSNSKKRPHESNIS